MRQRNDTGHVQDVMAWPTDEHPDLRPRSAAPGEVIDHPTLIGGFVQVPDDTPLSADLRAAALAEEEARAAAEQEPADEESAAAPTTAPAKPKTVRKSTAAPSPEGGEQQ